MPNLPPGAGGMLIISPSNPAPGDPILYTVHDNVRWMILGIHYLFQIISAGTDLYHRLTFKRSSTTFYTKQMTIPTNAAGFTSIQWEAGGGAHTGRDNDRLTCPFSPHIILSGGDLIQADVANIASGDKMTSVKIAVMQWIEL